MDHIVSKVATNVLQKASVLILGGGGLVGPVIAKHLGRLPLSLRPARVVVAALTQKQAIEAVKELERVNHNKAAGQSPGAAATKYIPAYGDIFVNHALAHLPPQDLKSDPVMRATLLEDMLGDFQPAYEQNHLVSMIREHKPTVIVDCINTATLLSYQDIFTASTRLQQAISVAKHGVDGENKGLKQLCDEAEKTLLSLSTPPLIRHVRCLQEVSREQQVQGYLKIGTTGTGGLGFNIPYTHSEDRPSRVLLSKSEAAFGHSGLLLLWSMTPGAPFVKELKPAAAIGYKTMDIRQVNDKHGNSSLYGGRIVSLKPEETGHITRPSILSLREDPSSFPVVGPMRMAVVDMGENGVFTEGEFLTITAPGQMELVSPEEISEMVIEELLSVSTGHNILAAMRGALLGPGYRAGINRTMSCNQLEQLCGPETAARMPREEVPTTASVALGKLGPPELSKLLFEARILAAVLGTWQKLRDCNADALSRKYATMVNQMASTCQLEELGTVENLFQSAISVGVPILFGDHQLLRGPNISIPEPKGTNTEFVVPSSGQELDAIVNKGWVDLRRHNLLRWKARAEAVLGQQKSVGIDGTSARYVDGDWHVYTSTKGDAIDPSAVVAWILAVELGGHRDIA